jgi:uncharacterized protein (TIGR00106 family)
MIIAQITISPFDKGVSVGKYVREAVKVIEESGLKYQVCSMATEVEAPDIETLLDVVKRAEQAVIDTGSKRVITTIKIDHRTDIDASMERKMRIAKGE